MALENLDFKRPNWSHLGRTGWGEERRREEEEEEEKKRRSGDQAKQPKGMETTLSMNFVWITWNLRLDMVNLLSLNLGF